MPLAPGSTSRTTLLSNGIDAVLRFDSLENVIPDAWTGSAVSNFGGNFWLGYSSTAAANYYAAPVELSASPFYGTDGNGGHSAVQDVSITNFSSSGQNQTIIGNVLQNIIGALPNNNTCNNWLQGGGVNNGISGLTQMQVVLQNNNFEHGTIMESNRVDYQMVAFSGNRNPDGTHVSGLPPSPVFLVNDVSAFFNAQWPLGNNRFGTFSLGPRGYAGNTLRAQAFTLIHETAHQIPRRPIPMSHCSS